MSGVNGQVNGSRGQEKSSTVAPLLAAGPTGPQLSPERIREIICELEVPFDPSAVEWRVTNVSENGRLRGQILPYADQRAYSDRLNALVTPAGWTRRYGVHASPSFERSKDKKTAVKLLVTCEVTIFGLGTHSATGEEWADGDNAGTSAEAQAFKRACACFGLGRYLYSFDRMWCDLDDKRRPRRLPQLPAWATPEGWRCGLRPVPRGSSASSAENGPLIREIKALAEPLGKGLYRGVLKTVARAWEPGQIRDRALLEKVLEHMRAAERGVRRLAAALKRVGPDPLGAILDQLKLQRLEQVDNLTTLKKIVVEMEAKAGIPPQGPS